MIHWQFEAVGEGGRGLLPAIRREFQPPLAPSGAPVVRVLIASLADSLEVKRARSQLTIGCFFSPPDLTIDPTGNLRQAFVAAVDAAMVLDVRQFANDHERASCGSQEELSASFAWDVADTLRHWSAILNPASPVAFDFEDLREFLADAGELNSRRGMAYLPAEPSPALARAVKAATFDLKNPIALDNLLIFSAPPGELTMDEYRTGYAEALTVLRPGANCRVGCIEDPFLSSGIFHARLWSGKSRPQV